MGGAPSKTCTIQITNLNNVYNLINPQNYKFSGQCSDPPQPTISSNKTEVCTFTETQGIVLTYDLFHMEKQECTGRMAILFSVPNNNNLIMGAGVFEIARECDKDLYHCMSEGTDFSLFTRGNVETSGIIYRGRTVELRATMSNAEKAIIKVEIHDNKKNKELFSQKTFNL